MHKSVKNIISQILSAHGFSKGKHVFYRTVGDQFHGIEFQNSKYGGSYFVNVAFHYSFIPAMLSLAKGIQTPIEEFDILDFMVHARLEMLQPPGYPKEWDIEVMSDQVLDDLTNNAVNAAHTLDRVSQRWKDPKAFINLLPPSVIEADYRFGMIRQADISSVRPYYVAMNSQWFKPRTDQLLYILTAISLHLGDSNLAKAYLDVKESLKITSPFSFEALAQRI